MIVFEIYFNPYTSLSHNTVYISSKKIGHPWIPQDKRINFSTKAIDFAKSIDFCLFLCYNCITYYVIHEVHYG